MNHDTSDQRLPQTLAQKLIARAAGRSHVAVGEVVTCRVDLAMFHDSSGPRRLKPMLDELGAKIWDPSKVVLVLDHYVPAQDVDAKRIIQITRDTAREWQLPHVIDSEGICMWCFLNGGICAPACCAWAAIRTHPPAEPLAAICLASGPPKCWA